MSVDDYLLALQLQEFDALDDDAAQVVEVSIYPDKKHRKCKIYTSLSCVIFSL